MQYKTMITLKITIEQTKDSLLQKYILIYS
mgnify:CR=1 FL=1